MGVLLQIWGWSAGLEHLAHWQGPCCVTLVRKAGWRALCQPCLYLCAQRMLSHILPEPCLKSCAGFMIHSTRVTTCKP